MRSPKPPRPPPPYVLRNLSGHSPTSINNNLSTQQQQQQSPIYAEQQNLYNTSSNNNNNNNINDSNNNYNAEGPPWTCNMCTFRNHPLLNKCEQCEMPRISGTIQITSTQFTPPPLQKMNYQKSSSSSSLSSLNSNHYATLTPDNVFLSATGHTHNPTITSVTYNGTNNNNNNNQPSNHNPNLTNDSGSHLIYAMPSLPIISPIVPTTSSFKKTHRHTPSM